MALSFPGSLAEWLGGNLQPHISHPRVGTSERFAQDVPTTVFGERGGSTSVMAACGLVSGTT
jgi:hypothetical protein